MQPRTLWRQEQPPGDAGIDTQRNGSDTCFGALSSGASWTLQDKGSVARRHLTPADAGPKQTGEPTEAPIRSQRPEAQEEVMLKLVETAVIDEELNGSKAHLEPHQLGVVVPTLAAVGHRSRDGPNYVGCASSTKLI